MTSQSEALLAEIGCLQSFPGAAAQLGECCAVTLVQAIPLGLAGRPAVTGERGV